MRPRMLGGTLMRRFISYIALSSALILGSALATVPVIMNMDGDLSYADGQTLYFHASPYDETSENGNYSGSEDGDYSFIDNNNYITEGEKAPIEYIAETMRGRLDKWGVSGYKVETQGAYTVAVSLRVGNNDSTTLDYVQRLLTFNGGSYSLDASNITYEGYSFNEKWNDLLDTAKTEIKDIDMQGYKVPVVVVPLKEGSDYKTAFKDLIKYCVNNTDLEDPAQEEEQATEKKTTNLVIWGNRSSTDPESFDDAQTNPNVAKKVILVESVLNNNAEWYEASDTEKENPSLQMIPSSKATSSGSYDPTYTQEAYDAARFIYTLMTSDDYSYSAFSGLDVTNRFALSYLYSQRATASVENLISLGWNLEPAMSKTLIAILVTVAFIVLILALFERIFAFIHVAAFVSVGFASFGTFVAFGAQFNIAALIGLAVAALIGLFGSLFFTSRLKDEIYKGRTLKKASSEAGKRATMPILDAGIISVIAGVCIYLLGGDIAAKAGVMIVLGGFFSLIFNLIITRIALWMFCNDVTTPSTFPKLIGINKERIPDVIKLEKQSYFGPYAEKKFSRGKIAVAIVSCALVLAGTGAMIGWGVTNNANFFNSTAYSEPSSVLRIDVRSDKSDAISVESLARISDIYNEEKPTDPSTLLGTYKINDDVLGSLVADAKVSSSSKDVTVGTDSDALEHEYWFFYEIDLNKHLDHSSSSSYVYYRFNGSEWVDLELTSLSDLSTAIHHDVVGEEAGRLIISFDEVKPEALTPYFYQVSLALGIAIAANLLYLMLRYRPSRGISVALLSASAGFSAVSFYALTRISTTPVVALGAIPVILILMLASIYVLAGEKDIYRESREKDKDTLESRNQNIEVSTSRQAGNVILFVLLALYVVIMFFAFGPREYASPYLAAVLGLVLSLAMVLCLLAPSSQAYAKAFSHFRLNGPAKGKKKKKKPANQGGQLMKRKKGAEPEEAIFIGIND